MAAPMHPDVLVDVLRNEGLTVVLYDGWDRRCRCCPDSGPHRPDGPWNIEGRGWGDVNGTVVHITAGNLNGRTVQTYIRDIINGDDAVPVKAQFVVAPDGAVYINATGRANHAGKVGSRVRDHLRAADFALDDPYDDRFRGGDVDGNAFTYGIENIAASKMTDAQRATSVKICAAIGRHYQWSGQESVGHGEISSARYPADPNLDMGQFRRDVMAQVGGTPTPTPTPPHKVDFTVLFQPLAGYNKATAPGVTNWVANTDASTAIAVKVNPDLIGTTELSNKSVNPMLPRYTDTLAKAHAKGIVRAKGGTDGRYVFRNQQTMTWVESGAFSAPAASLLNGDDKQAAWYIGNHIRGLRVCAVAGHTENQAGTDKKTGKDADDLRVEQALYFARQGERAGIAHNADVAVFVLDGNSDAMVRRALERAGWVIGDPGYFVGWKRDKRHPFDLACIKPLRAGVTVDVKTEHHINPGSDHTYLIAHYVATLPA